MKKIILFFFTFLIVVSEAASLRLADISPMMTIAFSQHIECKNYTPMLVQRALKNYIESFDSDGLYLLEKEVLSYLSLTNERAQKLTEDFKKGDFSIFMEINAVIEKSIERARFFRQKIMAELLKGDDTISKDSSNSVSFSLFENEIKRRQKNSLITFLEIYKERSKIYNHERKFRLFDLWDKRVRKLEESYFYHKEKNERATHLFALRILKAFAKSLDAHSAFFSEEEASEMRMSLEKHFEGVGVVLGESIDGVMIMDLVKGGPAELSGKIKANDIIEEVNGKYVGNLPFEDVLTVMKGDGKDVIEFGLKRISINGENQTEQKWKVALRRQVINMEEERVHWSYELVDGGIIGKIVLPGFYESDNGISCEKDVRDAIKALKGKGNLKGLILDLRDNAGGFLGQAIKVAGLFIPNGVIVIAKYSQGEMHYFRNLDGKLFYNGPLIVLTSKLSASASEIVAQALQDYGVALIVGDKQTFGKGSIQYQTITNRQAAIYYKITVGKYYTASGKTTQIDGVIADIVVPSKLATFDIGERFLKYPLPRDRVDAAFKDPLLDVDPKVKFWLQRYYVPNIQKVVTFWQKMLPALRENSMKRLNSAPALSSSIAKVKNSKGDEREKLGKAIDNLQMEEAINIMKDMIIIEKANNRAAGLSLLVPCSFPLNATIP